MYTPTILLLHEEPHGKLLNSPSKIYNETSLDIVNLEVAKDDNLDKGAIKSNTNGKPQWTARRIYGVALCYINKLECYGHDLFTRTVFFIQR